jgi:DNA-directed RNA polymerase subunit RPC12/RpoP
MCPNMRKYNFKLGRRWCSRCDTWFSEHEFKKTTPWCPKCKSRKLRTKPRSKNRSKDANDLVDYHDKVIVRY